MQVIFLCVQQEFTQKQSAKRFLYQGRYSLMHIIKPSNQQIWQLFC